MAEDGNLLSDYAAGQIAELIRNKGTISLPQGPRYRPNLFRDSPLGIRFKNTSSEAMPPFGVGAVTGRDEDSAGKFLTLAKPSTTFRRRYLVNGGYEIRAGGFGWAQVGEVLDYAYDSGTPAVDEGWGPKPGQWTLSLAYPQITCVEGIISSTDKILRGTWQLISSGVGEATEDITAATTGTIAVYQGSLPGSIISHSAVDMEIECFCPMDLTNGDTVAWGYYNGQLAAFPWDCGA